MKIFPSALRIILSLLNECPQLWPQRMPGMLAIPMSLFDKIIGSNSPSDSYQTEAQFETNLARQVSMTRQVECTPNFGPMLC